MPTPRTLRDYQVDAFAAVEADWDSGTRRVGVVLPTGAGKSTVIAALACRAYRRGQRVVLLAHRAELLSQMLDAVRAVDPLIPEYDLGIVRAEQDDSHAAIVAATLQTLGSAHRRLALGQRDVILWDEVHHAGAAGWHATFSDMDGYGDNTYMCGFTATMRRSNNSGVSLGEIIEKVSYERTLRWAIDSGFLVQPQGLTVRVPDLHLEQLKTVAGDFHQGELAEMMEAANEYVVDAVRLHAINRRPIIFAASVAAAQDLAVMLTEAGYPAESTTGAMSYEERQPVYERFRTGETRALVTVMVLTEGADFPMCDCVVLARPTQSPNLFSQMVGRALRLYPNKTDALVLDLSGTTRVLKLVSLTSLDPDAYVRAVTPEGDEILEPEPVEEAEPAPARVKRAGPVDMTVVDLLGDEATNTLWLSTVRGIPFVPGKSDIVGFLWPHPENGPEKADGDLYAPGVINVRSGRGSFLATERHESDEPQFAPVGDASEIVEHHMASVHGFLPQRTASWRRSQAPSEAQLNMARRLGIPDAEGMTKARVSDEISVTFASRRLDAGLPS